MKSVRMIPVLLLMGDGLYKTVCFNMPVYVGDPVNTVRIFNEKGADELVLLDITRNKEQINFELISRIAGEAFMPMSYGGGIRSFEHAQKVLNSGFEKVIVNSCSGDRGLLRRIAGTYGNQSLVVSIDIGKTWRGNRRVFIHNGKEKIPFAPRDYAKVMEESGAGEIILNAIHKDGTWSGYDLDLIREVSEAVNIPVIALGGASGFNDFKAAVASGASAVAAGSYFVFQKKGMGVLIKFPESPLTV